MQKNRKSLIFVSLVLFASTGVRAPSLWQRMKVAMGTAVSSPLAPMVTLLNGFLIEPVPLGYTDEALDTDGKAMRLDKISGNSERDRALPVSLFTSQLKALLEGTLGKELPVTVQELNALLAQVKTTGLQGVLGDDLSQTVKELNVLLAQAKKSDKSDFKLSDLTGNSEHSAVPVTNVVVKTHYLFEKHRNELDQMIRFYAKRVGIVAIVGIAGYCLYKVYTTIQARKKENIAKIEACFSLRNSQEKKPIDLNPTAKKMSALGRRWQDKKGGCWILTSADKNEAEIISELACDTRIAIVQGQVLKAYAADSSLQQRIIAAMQALVDANIPLVVLRGDEVLKEGETVKWIAVSFNNNKIAFLSTAADASAYQAYGFTEVNLSLPETAAAA